LSDLVLQARAETERLARSQGLSDDETARAVDEAERLVREAHRR
jgi:hypothetical protein